MWEDPGPGEIGCQSERPLAAVRHRQFSLYVYGITKVGRNAKAFLENAAGIHWYRTLLGGVHGIVGLGLYKDKNLYAGPGPFNIVQALGPGKDLCQ